MTSTAQNFLPHHHSRQAQAMSGTYPKIETLFDRSEDFTVDVNRFRRPEFGLINTWVMTEKVDGTNIRLIFDRGASARGTARGKTDNASLHPKLLEHLTEEVARMRGDVDAIMDEHTLTELVLFGEGYGEKIQSGGRYRTASKDQAFILFDVRANGAWLDEDAVNTTAERLALTRVPTITGASTIDDAVELCQSGFASDTAEVFDNTFLAEGVVAKTSVPLYDRRGERVMWKLKTRDFKAGKR